MKKKKFTFLLFDDEGSGGDSAGFTRVIDFLMEKHYLSPANDIVIDPESKDGEIVGDLPLNIYLWGRPSNVSFDEIIHRITNNYPLIKEADVFFIDVKWDIKGIDEESDLLVEVVSNWSTYIQVNYEHIAQRGKIPHIIAGLKILKGLLKDHEKPKILFSGSNETRPVRYILSDLFEERTNLKDLITKGLDGSGIGEMDKKIQAYMEFRQRRIIQHLKQPEIDELVRRIETGEDFGKFDIPDPDENFAFWSMRTLFPKLGNAETTHFGHEMEQIRERVMETLESYPYLIHLLIRFAHRQHLAYNLIDQTNRLIKREFKKIEDKRDGADPALKFVGIEFFIRNRLKMDNNIQGTMKPFNIREEILTYNWPFKRYTVKKQSRENGLEIVNNGLKDILDSSMLKAGFYPGYLDYILKIAENNAAKYEQVIEEIIVETPSESDIFRIIFTGKAPIEVKAFENFKDKLLKSKINTLFPHPYSEGVEDIFKIICFRYHGYFSLLGRHHQVKSFLEADQPQVLQSEGLREDLAENQIAYEISVMNHWRTF